MYILADMLYIYKPLRGIEGGPLVDYREVVTSGIDTIPGRTRDESLDMINRAIEFIITVGAMQAEERQRVLIKRMSVIILSTVGLIGTLWASGWAIPQLAQVLSP